MDLKVLLKQYVGFILTKYLKHNHIYFLVASSLTGVMSSWAVYVCLEFFFYTETQFIRIILFYFTYYECFE